MFQQAVQSAILRWCLHQEINFCVQKDQMCKNQIKNSRSKKSTHAGRNFFSNSAMVLKKFILFMFQAFLSSSLMTLWRPIYRLTNVYNITSRIEAVTFLTEDCIWGSKVRLAVIQPNGSHIIRTPFIRIHGQFKRTAEKVKLSCLSWVKCHIKNPNLNFPKLNSPINASHRCLSCNSKPKCWIKVSLVQIIPQHGMKLHESQIKAF